MQEGEVNMREEMFRERAIQIVIEASEEYEEATTKKEVEEIFIQYWKHGIGYAPLCRVFFSQVSPDRAVRVY